MQCYAGGLPICEKEMDISQLWRLNSLGYKILQNKKKTKEKLHKASMEHFLRTVKVDEESDFLSPYHEYGDVFKEWKREGIIEEVPKEELKSVSYYLPHRHVVKPDSTTKLGPSLMLVKQKGVVSLNDCLEKGFKLD
ncbi:integrase catalytic domain-containing protein [Trichonephila clavipes]|nr:integrase catalytic domain-containing protein [Trichonephila clavipes]